MWTSCAILCWVVMAGHAGDAGPAAPPAVYQEVKPMADLVLEPASGARFRFEGLMGDRVQANLEQWLLAAPAANPGMLEMFHLRDRQPPPELVPWAGEFVGKYLLSAIPVRRMLESPELEALVRQVIHDLIAAQAEDGYLGPFRQEERLLGHWDLWGHYHWMLALMQWEEETGDREALAAVRRAADLICRTYLDGDRRVFDAGSHEMNMAVIHALGRLYLKTGEARYLRMVEEIEKDWERAGDYFRTGLAGKPFYRTPRPRWESLHDLQGLVELYLITGNEDYRTAFANLWRSIAWYDRHNTGGFSTNEQAVGDPYALGAIETCCTVAWIALSVDMLRLTGSSLAADELEWSTFNTILGAQHPSGRWFTYDTPMDGARAASAHAIVFQARVGTPELNCCSVNGPRGLGMLADWAVMLDEQGPVVNYYGPCRMDLELADGVPLGITQETDYPVGGDVRLRLALDGPAAFSLRLRIPFWSKETGVQVNGEPVAGVEPGDYLAIGRRWQDGDVVELSLDMRLRAEPGERAQAGKASLFRGPLLLAFDQHYNGMDTGEAPALDLDRLQAQPVEADVPVPPWVLLEVQAEDGTPLRLCDFASAGAYGTRYLSWLPAVRTGPGAFYLTEPRDGARVPAAPFLLRWTGARVPRPSEYRQTVIISRQPDGRDPVLQVEDVPYPWLVVEERLEPGAYYWQVVRGNEHGQRANEYGLLSFTVDPALESQPVEAPQVLTPRADGLVVAAALDGDGTPAFGRLEDVRNVTAAEDRHGDPAGAVAFNGSDSRVRYAIPYFPGEDYTVLCRVCPEGLPEPHISQIFSAWANGGDDPLRITIDNGQVCARIEAGAYYGTPGVPLENGRWTHVAAVKLGEQLMLYVDGELRQTAPAPRAVFSNAENVALGANPNFWGDEYFQGRIDDFAFYARALTGEEIQAHLQD